MTPASTPASGTEKFCMLTYREPPQKARSANPDTDLNAGKPKAIFADITKLYKASGVFAFSKDLSE